MTAAPSAHSGADIACFAGAPIEHGGGLDAARRRFPMAPRPWIDLSTGVSPRAYPLPDIAIEAWTRLPDADARQALEIAAARAYRAPAQMEIVAGAGAQAFIQRLPQLFAARRIATLGFTYAEHAARWRAAGAKAGVAQSLDELAAADVAIVVNPNNPDGRLAAPRDLVELSRRLAPRGGLLIVDEAFVDFTPAASVSPVLAEEEKSGANVVILRSFGKAYGLPGLRLGFALCSPRIAAQLREALGPWSVSGQALAVGAVALADSAWLEESRVYLEEAARRLDALLLDAGFAIIGGTSLFRLAESEAAAAWFERLCRAGILTRGFRERPSWLRFGLPGDPRDWERLTEALEAGPHV
jgi:cobalamin biosynthetic protein CobC